MNLKQHHKDCQFNVDTGVEIIAGSRRKPTETMFQLVRKNYFYNENVGHEVLSNSNSSMI